MLVSVERAVPDRREVVELRVPRRGLLEPLLGLSKLAVLHLDLHVMDVQIVDEALAIRFARLRREPLLRGRELLELADELCLGHRLEVAWHHGAPRRSPAPAGSMDSSASGASVEAGIRLAPTRTLRSPPSGRRSRSS
jgi:hypothetical protein